MSWITFPSWILSAITNLPLLLCSFSLYYVVNVKKNKTTDYTSYERERIFPKQGMRAWQKFLEKNIGASGGIVRAQGLWNSGRGCRYCWRLRDCCSLLSLPWVHVAVVCCCLLHLWSCDLATLSLSLCYWHSGSQALLTICCCYLFPGLVLRIRVVLILFLIPFMVPVISNCSGELLMVVS